GDADGDHALPGVLAEVGEGGMEIALEEDPDVADVPHELEGAKLDDARGPAQEDGHGEGREQRPPHLGAAGGQGRHGRRLGARRTSERRGGKAGTLAAWIAAKGPFTRSPTAARRR